MSKSKLKYTNYLFVLIYFGAVLFFQTNFSEKILIGIYDDTKFWDKFFDLIFYSFFTVVFINTYIVQIKESIANIKKDSFKHVLAALLFILITMVISAIVLSYCGIGESANQQEISNDISTNGLITFIVAVLIGPIVEEIVFRGVIYSSLRGKEPNLIRCISANLITSFVFALYHCNAEVFLAFHMEQILSVLPLFFMGGGLAYVQEKTSNIICPFITHMIINLISLG